MNITSITVGFPVSKVEEARRWYQAVFGSKNEFSPATGICELELCTDVWLQVMDDSGVEQPSTTLRIGVRDLDAERTRLISAGVKVDDILVYELTAAPGKIRLFYFQDPWGNRLCLYHLPF